MKSGPTAAQMLEVLQKKADPSRVPILQRFFRTQSGEYGEGDRFIGVTVPSVRMLSRRFRDAALDEIDALLHSPIHEARLLALVLMVQAFRRAPEGGQRTIYKLYLSRTRWINSWDLVDSSAPQILGAWLAHRSREPLWKLARSQSLWERRMAIIATHHFIKEGDLTETFAIAEVLLADEHDLIHKAVGWMLREAGKRDAAAARRFLTRRAARMPRTMLRYAIENLSEQERRTYLRAEARSGEVRASTDAALRGRAG
jgi:3-methyladenine DNA glycosylase AlkD